jgi:hypothetical protein
MKNLSRTALLMMALLLASTEAMAQWDVPVSTVMWWHGCKYSLTATPLPNALPPIYDITVSRTASSSCVADSIYLSTTYVVQDLRLTATGSSIVAAYSFKASPSGSASTAVGINHLDEYTLDVRRYSELRVYPGNFTPWVSVSKVSFSGTWLIVEGTKDGDFVEQTGSGPNYTAAYPTYLTSELPPTIRAY